MLAMLLSPVGRLMAGVALGVALIAGIYLYAYQRGAAAERTAALQRSVEILRERTRTDDRIKGMDDASLCRALGGRWVQDDGTCQ